MILFFINNYNNFSEEHCCAFLFFCEFGQTIWVEELFGFLTSSKQRHTTQILTKFKVLSYDNIDYFVVIHNFYSI